MSTRIQVANKVRENLNDSGVTFYSLADINDSLQDAYADIAVVTGCIQKSADLTQTDATTYYDMPSLISDFFAVVAAYNNTTKRWIDFDNLRGYDNVRIDWELWTGSQPMFGTVSNYRYIGFLPRMESASGTIAIFYRATAPVLSSDSDTFLIHLDEEKLLEWYATADLFDQAQEFIKAERFWGKYLGTDPGHDGTTVFKYKSRIGKLAQSDYLPVIGTGAYAI